MTEHHRVGLPPFAGIVEKGEGRGLWKGVGEVLLLLSSLPLPLLLLLLLVLPLLLLLLPRGPPLFRLPA